jgi:hypothetical protein
MDSVSTFILVISLCLGIGLIAAIIGFILFNGFDWWDKL